MMRVDLTCPVELWHYALPTAEYPLCRLQLFNLTDKKVVSIQAVFTCYDDKGTVMSRQVERLQNLEGIARNAFEVEVSVDDGVQADGLDFSIEKVWLSDGTVWRHENSNVASYTPNQLPASRQLDTLRSMAGPDAAGYPSDQGGVWVCVCGRPNRASMDTCIRCGRGKRDVFTHFNEAAVETLLFERDTAREAEERRQAARLAREKREQQAAIAARRKRRRRILIGVLTVLVLAVLAFGGYFHLLPEIRFNRAVSQLDSGLYDTARQAFEELAEEDGKRSLPIAVEALHIDFDLFNLSIYGKSAELVRECDYRQALAAMENGTIQSLRTAQDLFDSLKDYKDSATLSMEARYMRADWLLVNRQYASAIDIYTGISGYKDASGRILAAQYQWANSLYESLDYARAREKYLALGAYEDSARLAKMCLYIPGSEALERSDWLTALEYLSQLEESFEGTALKLQQANYGAGSQAFSQGDYDTAAQYYLAAGDYRDAYSQAIACLYEPAVEQYELGEYEQAMAMFESILAYRDAQDYALLCRCALAERALAAQDYDTARTWVEDYLEYAGPNEVYRRTLYLQASEYQTLGNLDAAIALLEEIPDYEDARERLSAMYYAKAEEARDAGYYTQAAEAFEQLGDWGDARDQAAGARYQQALQLMDEARYTEAIEQLGKMSGYMGADTQIRRAWYALAQEAEQAGDYASAMEGYEQAGDLDDAQTRYSECVVVLARQAVEADDYERASTYLNLIPSYAPAAAVRDSTVYHAAELKRDEGAWEEAAELFLSVDGYEDAAAQAEVCYDQYYGDVYLRAFNAMESRDYQTAYNLLTGVHLENRSVKYADIKAMYQEATYNLANQLYDDRKPYQALTYYSQIPDYKDVSTVKMDRLAYLMLGKWVSKTGVVMEFNADGTCKIDGTFYYFYPNGYSLYLGKSESSMKASWTIHSCNGSKMSMTNTKTKKQYSLTKQTETAK